MCETVTFSHRLKFNIFIRNVECHYFSGTVYNTRLNDNVLRTCDSPYCCSVNACDTLRRWLCTWEKIKIKLIVVVICSYSICAYAFGNVQNVGLNLRHAMWQKWLLVFLLKPIFIIFLIEIIFVIFSHTNREAEKNRNEYITLLACCVVFHFFCGTFLK